MRSNPTSFVLTLALTLSFDSELLLESESLWISFPDAVGSFVVVLADAAAAGGAFKRAMAGDVFGERVVVAARFYNL